MSYAGSFQPYVEIDYDGIDVDVTKKSSITIRAKAIGYATWREALDAYVKWEDKKYPHNPENVPDFAGLKRGRIRIHEIGGAEFVRRYTYPVELLKCWEIECEHTTDDSKSDSEYAQVSFSTSAEIQHITQSLGTMCIRSCKSGYPAANYGGGIGYNGESFEGCDVMRPTLTFTQEKLLPVGEVTDKTMRRISNLTGCINDRPFHGFEGGEVLFVGLSNATIEKLDLDSGGFVPYWRMSFDFKVSRNMYDITIGESKPFFKAGWDYLWVVRRKFSSINGTTIDLPVQVNVEQVYPDANFKVFKLPSLDDYFTVS